MVEASREGVRIAIARGVTAVHDKDGWLGALGVWQRLRDERSLHLRVWQSIPAEQVDELEALRIRSGFGDDLVRIGYLKTFMDGTLGSQTARMLDGTGVRDHQQGRARRDHPPRRSRRSARRRPCDRRPREPRSARCLRGDPKRMAAARPTPSHRARAGARTGGHPPLRRARHAGVGAVQPCALRPRPRRPLLGQEDGRGLCVSLAARRRRAAGERLRCADRGARPVGRRLRGRAAHDRLATRMAPRAAT